jgi:uncharacterized membrane protein YczE
VPDDTSPPHGPARPPGETLAVIPVVVEPPRPDAPAAQTPVGRAWSRAGAIAAVLAAGPAHRALRWSARVGLVVAGSILIAVSVAVVLWIDLGPGPLDVFIGAVRVQTGLALGVTVWLVLGSMIAAAWVAGLRPGPGTLLSPLIVGAAMQVAVDALEGVDRPDELFVRLVAHMIAIAGIGLGAGALIASRLGAGSGELLATALARRTGRTEARVRTVIEMGWLAVGITLGGPIGIGTLLLAVTIGPAVVTGHRAVDRALGRFRVPVVADCCDGKR